MKQTSIKSLIMSLALITTAPMVSANLIDNGDFESCNYNTWVSDTDGSPGVAPEFTILDTGDNCAAQLRVDDGETTFTFLSNILSTDLNFTANLGDTLTLSFDWDFSGNGLQTIDSDTFLVTLIDEAGNIFNAEKEAGNLIQPIFEYGNGVFSSELNSAFFNLTDIRLEFQLFEGFEVVSMPFFSTLTIDNVSLIRTTQEISAPATSALFCFFCIALFKRTSHSRTLKKLGN